MKRVLADFKNPDRAVDIPRAAVTEGVVSEEALLAIKNCTIQIRPDVIKSPEQDDDGESSDGSHSPLTHSLPHAQCHTRTHTHHILTLPLTLSPLYHLTTHPVRPISHVSSQSATVS